MPTNVPGLRPQMKKEEALKFFEGHEVSAYPVKLLGIRGYYKKTMGNPVKNDVGIYDDAIIVMANGVYRTFNANTDPTVLAKGIAMLKPGLHLYKKGNHGISRPGGGYPAFRPASKDESLPVTRDGKDSRGIAINIHRGSIYSTSSEGCQTIYPSQWDEFQKLVYHLMASAKQTIIPYLLVEA